VQGVMRNEKCGESSTEIVQRTRRDASQSRVHASRQRDTGAKSAERLKHGRASIEVTDWEGSSSCDSFSNADRNALRCRYTTAGFLSWLQGEQPPVYSFMQAAGCKVSIKDKDRDENEATPRTSGAPLVGRSPG
jgi:hypothetical protein